MATRFVDALIFFGEFVGGERFAILSYRAADGNAIEPEVVGLGDDGLLHVAVPVELLLRFDGVVDVVLLDGFGLALVALDIVHQGDDVGRGVGRSGVQRLIESW